MSLDQSFYAVPKSQLPTNSARSSEIICANWDPPWTVNTSWDFFQLGGAILHSSYPQKKSRDANGAKHGWRSMTDVLYVQEPIRWQHRPNFCCLSSCPHLASNQSTLSVLALARLFPLGMKFLFHDLLWYFHDIYSVVYVCWGHGNLGFSRPLGPCLTWSFQSLKDMLRGGGRIPWWTFTFSGARAEWIQIHILPWLVGGWATLLKNMSSSVGMMTFPTEWKN